MKNKINIIICSCLMILYSNIGYGQYNLDWVKGISSNNYIRIKSIVTDQYGNIYTCGNYRGTADFDLSSGQYNLTSNGADDIFIAKYDEFGGLIWVQSIGGTQSDYAVELKIDNQGDIVVVGNYYAVLVSIDFDSGPGVSDVSGSGLFVLKLNSDGIFVWVKQVLTNGITCLDIGPNNNICIGGMFDYTVDFDPGSGVYYMGSPISTNGDGFILMLDANGDFIWAKQTEGAYLTQINDLKIDNVGNVLTTGYFEGTTDFNPGPIQNFHTSVGSFDNFILKLDNLGNYMWSKQFGGASGDIAFNLGTDQLENIYVSGVFSTTADLNPDDGAIENYTSNGLADMFLIKTNSNGDFVWANQIGGIGEDEPTVMAVHADGNTFLSGYYTNTVDFDPGSGVTNLTSIGSSSSFVQVIDPDGNLVWVNNYTNSGYAEGYSICVDSLGNIYAAGNFDSQTNFNPTLSPEILIPEGISDSYFIKLNTCKDFTSENTSSCESYTWPANGMTYNQSGTYKDTLTNVAGCDSILTLDLLINATTTGSDSQTACGSYTWVDGNTYTTSNNTATYTFIGGAITGCDSILTLNLTINPLPVNTISQNGLDLTSDANGINYQWIDCNNNNFSIVGETNQTYTPIANGNYAVIVANNNCSDTSNCITIDDVGLEENINSTIQVYPNPTHGVFSVDIGNNEELIRLSVIDLSGKVIFNTSIVNSNSTIDISNFEEGIYFVEIHFNNSKPSVIKLIKND